MGKEYLKHVSEPIMSAGLLSRVQGNFFTANLTAIRSDIETQPWVRSASIRREWPDKLIVAVEEHEPLGLWGDDGRFISNKGELFDVNSAEAEEDGPLVSLSGPLNTEKDVLAHFLLFNQWLSPLKNPLHSVTLSNNFGWSIALDNGTVVQFGRDESHDGMHNELHEKVKTLIKVYPRIVAGLNGGINSIDMRYQNGLSVKPTVPISLTKVKLASPHPIATKVSVALVAVKAKVTVAPALDAKSKLAAPPSSSDKKKVSPVHIAEKKISMH